MSKEDGVLRRNLLIAKAHILLHDPPHKAWVLKEHEDVAKELRDRILGNASPLNRGLRKCGRTRLEGLMFLLLHLIDG
jgi:hypothetical protein